jgi:Mn-containing catalase
MTEKLKGQKAIEALEELKNDENTDVKVNNFKLKVLKEQIKIQEKYTKEGEQNDEEVVESEELIAVRNHLELLNLAPAGTPIDEIARLATLKIMDLEMKLKIKEKECEKLKQLR